MKVIFLFIWIATAFASSELKLVDGSDIMHLAVFTNVVLETNESGLVHSLKENKEAISLGDIFYLQKVSFLQEVKSNNYQLGLVLVLKKIPTDKKAKISIGKDEFLVTFNSINFDPSESQLQAKSTIGIKQYNLAQFKLWLQSHKMFLISVVVLVSLFGIWIGRKFFKQWQQRKKVLYEERKLKDLLLQAKSRSEMEKLYQIRKQWWPFVSSNKAQDFTDYVNQIQFAPDWSPQEFHEVAKRLDQLKKSIN